MGKEGEMGGHLNMGGHLSMGPQESPARAHANNGSSGHAGIVVRATVESFGVAGDTELNITVKWPAATMAAQGSEAHAHRSSAEEGPASDGSLQATVHRRPPPA